MNFFKTIFKHRKWIFTLGFNDFKNRFASTSLGTLWGFLNPFIFMGTYVIVFQFILRAGGPNDNTPYLVWFLPGIAIWLFLNDGILSASNSIRGYSYLVKKVVFPVDIIPLISIVASSVSGMFITAVATIVCIVFGFVPNVLHLIYVLFATYCFLIAITRFTSAVTTLVPDFGQLLSIVMQLFFWFTPVIWNLGMLDGHNILLNIMKCSPFAYLVTNMRDVFIVGDNLAFEKNGFFTIVFWVLTILIFVWGNYIFNRTKRDFADVL